MLEQGAITTYKKDRSIADELALESLSITATLSRKTMMGVSKGTRSSDSWSKFFVRKMREFGSWCKGWFLLQQKGVVI